MRSNDQSLSVWISSVFFFLSSPNNFLNTLNAYYTLCIRSLCVSFSHTAPAFVNSFHSLALFVSLYRFGVSFCLALSLSFFFVSHLFSSFFHYVTFFHHFLLLTINDPFLYSLLCVYTFCFFFSHTSFSLRKLQNLWVYFFFMAGTLSGTLLQNNMQTHQHQHVWLATVYRVPMQRWRCYAYIWMRNKFVFFICCDSMIMASSQTN